MNEIKLTTPEIEQAVRICGSKKNGGSGCFGCPLQGVTRCVNRLFEELAAENTRLREENRMIPVSERLPDAELAQVPRFPDGTMKLPGYEAIVHIEGAKGCTTLWYLVEEDGTKLWCDDEGVPYRVTHWKPMPDGPEAEA